MEELKELSSETKEYVELQYHTLSLAGIVSMIYTKGFEKGRKLRYMDMRKRVLKEIDRCTKK